MVISSVHRTVCFTAVLTCLFSAGTTEAQKLLLRDDFNGSGIVDTSVWRLPFGSEGTFVGRTQFRGDSATDVPMQGVPEVGTDGVLEINLDTYSPIDPGNQFLGTDLLTKQNFARGGGLTIEARMRLKPTTSVGLVNGFFLFDVTRDSPPGANNLVRDEIDWELLGNDAVPGGSQDPASNYWNEGPFTGPGAGGDFEKHNVAGLDLTQFQDYKIEWTPQSVKWYVNNNLVRTETTNVPDDPMKLHFNLWAADSDFGAAFNSLLQPEADPLMNETFTAQIDWVEVNQINTNESANLLTNPSFEDNLGSFDGWTSFGNAFIEASDPLSAGVPDTAPDGIYMAKFFGPFFNPGEASGATQRVAAAPGEEFEARVEVATAGGDSILGTENFNLLVLRFLDSGGAIITEAFADPSEMRDSNGQSFPLLDGRDPNAMNDVFYEGVVNAIAPAGTAEVEYGLFFVQLGTDGGSAYYDNASLVRLTAQTLGLDGDFNGDGIVNTADYVKWRANLGATEDGSILNGNGNGGVVDETDYALWRSNFGATNPVQSAVTATPEPGSLLLIFSFVGFTALRRQR